MLGMPTRGTLLVCKCYNVNPKFKTTGCSKWKRLKQKAKPETWSLACQAQHFPLAFSKALAFCTSKILYFSVYPVGIVAANSLVKSSSVIHVWHGSPVWGLIWYGKNRPCFCLSRMLSSSFVSLVHENLVLKKGQLVLVALWLSSLPVVQQLIHLVPGKARFDMVQERTTHHHDNALLQIFLKKGSI